MPTLTRVKTRWRLKGCPRCGGDLYLNDDGEWECLQCGRGNGKRKDVQTDNG